MITKQIALSAKSLSKSYKIYPHPRDLVLETITRKPRHTNKTVLDSIDLELYRGEIIGILGRNGAGKSTLLKVISGTVTPTSGELNVFGRITAILELGTGFHPEYSGLENIYMGGFCLGMTRDEIDRKLDSIIDFSELREYIHQPFKTYSSGMQARLTFSTAISVDPDILIVDEALSVGDARFQMKCFARLQELRKKKTTILLVSHDINTITTICDRALILENGRVYAEGDVKEISYVYHHLLFKDTTEPASNNTNDDLGLTTNIAMSNPPTTSMRYGTGEAQIVSYGLLNANGDSISVIQSGDRCQLYVTFACKTHINDLSAGFAIKDRKGTALWGITNISQGKQASVMEQGEHLTIRVDCTMWLAVGDYFITVGGAHLQDGQKIDFIEDALQFKVTCQEGAFTTSIVNLQSTMKITSNMTYTEELLS